MAARVTHRLARGLGGVLIAFGLAAMPVCGFFFVGSWGLMLIGGTMAALSLLWERLRPLLRRVGLTALLLGLGLIALLSGWMIRDAWYIPPDDGDYTVVVLGAKVHGDNPTLMLKNRLVIALDMLVLHPDWPVVVTGGQGANETRTEASVMAGWLRDRGVDARRIVLEDRSVNTAENIAYAAALIERERLPPRMLIVSDAFHLARARLHAKNLGYEAATRPALTPWWLEPAYWMREMLALVVAGC